MKILITGICGFVGSALAECLLERRARDLDRGHGQPHAAGRGDEPCRRLKKLGVDVHARRHPDARAISTRCPQCDWVIDAAANPSVLAGIRAASAAASSSNITWRASATCWNTARSTQRGSAAAQQQPRLLHPALAVAAAARATASFRRGCRPRSCPAGVSAQRHRSGLFHRARQSLFTEAPSWPRKSWLSNMARRSIFRYGSIAAACWPAPGSSARPTQGIFAYWVNAHLRRRPLRYIGFDGTGKQTRDAVSSARSGGPVIAQMRSRPGMGQRIYTAGGGPANAMSLAQLTAWCDGRFGPHAPSADPVPRRYDIPWVVMDNSDAPARFRLADRDARCDVILEDIAQHAERHPDWLELSRA